MYKRHSEALIGKKIKRIFMNEDYLKFETDKGNIVFNVDGDCCSQSVFYDFLGVKKLFNNGAVVSFEDIELHPSDIIEENGDQKDKKSYQESIEVYGYRIVTVDSILGEVSSVFSFRNYSNGYYGGSLELCLDDKDVQPEIFEDVLETVSTKD